MPLLLNLLVRNHDNFPDDNFKVEMVSARTIITLALLLRLGTQTLSGRNWIERQSLETLEPHARSRYGMMD